MRRPKPDGRELAAQGLLVLALLAGAGCAKSEDEWTRDLASPDPFVRALGAFALCELEPARAARAVPVLLETVDRSDVGLRRHAEAALIESAPFVVGELLDALLRQEFMTLERRQAVTEALVAAGPHASSAIVETLRGPARALAGELGVVLVRIGEPSVPPLTELLARDGDPALQAHAAWLLGQLGPRASAALPALRAALSHADPAVRRAAGESIERVEAPSGESLRGPARERRGP